MFSGLNSSRQQARTELLSLIMGHQVAEKGQWLRLGSDRPEMPLHCPKSILTDTFIYQVPITQKPLDELPIVSGSVKLILTCYPSFTVHVGDEVYKSSRYVIYSPERVVLYKMLRICASLKQILIWRMSLLINLLELPWSSEFYVLSVGAQKAVFSSRNS